MDEKIYIQCPECDMPIDFSNAVRRIQDTSGDIILQGKRLSVYYVTCEFCDKKSVKVTIEPNESVISKKLEEPERLLN